MRPTFVFFLLLLIAPVMAEAADAAHPSATSTPVEAPVEALKKSLSKDDATHSEAKQTVKASPITWMDLSESRRTEILHAWLALPETTRPPFPVFRDTTIDKHSENDTVDDLNAETDQDDDAPRDDDATSE